MKKVFRRIIVSVILIVSVLAVAGCNKNDKKSKDGKTKVVIATSGSPAPYLYTNDKGKLEGYDIAVVNEVFSRLPQYEITYELTEFASIFSGLDSGFYQVGLNHMGYNHGRAEKYIFSDLYGQDQYGILVNEKNTDIKSVADFPGHSTEVSASSKNATLFENYNKEHPDKQVILKYTEVANSTPTGISNGTLDFEFFQITTLKSQVEAIGATNVKIIPVPNEDAISLTEAPIGNFVLFPKGYEQLAEDFNKALREAIEDGTIQKLRKQYLDVSDDDVLTIKDLDNAKEFIEKDIAK